MRAPFSRVTRDRILTAAYVAEITAAADAIAIEGGRYAEATERMTNL